MESVPSTGVPNEAKDAVSEQVTLALLRMGSCFGQIQGSIDGSSASWLSPLVHQEDQMLIVGWIREWMQPGRAVDATSFIVA